MLLNTSAIAGYDITTTDGHVGTVTDFLFDDATWEVRWLVADAAGAPAGGKLLLHPSAVTHLDPDERRIAVNLTTQQVQNSPDIGADPPVTQQATDTIHSYSGSSRTWDRTGIPGTPGFSFGVTGDLPLPGSYPSTSDIPSDLPPHGNPHLQSVSDITGYRIHAIDGEIGHVEDYLFEEADWTVRFLIVDAKTWWSDKKVLISRRSVRDIDDPNKLIHLNVDRERVKNSPAYNPSVGVDPAFETYYHSYYDGPKSDDPA